MEINEIVYDFITNNSKESIINGARRDYDTPFGYVLGLLKDIYNLTKIQAYPIAERIIKEYEL